jgi:hypothetical protein
MGCADQGKRRIHGLRPHHYAAPNVDKVSRGALDAISESSLPCSITCHSAESLGFLLNFVFED